MLADQIADTENPGSTAPPPRLPDLSQPGAGVDEAHRALDDAEPHESSCNA
ncbi:hypothetical protein IU447_09815 [Nocardia farcinica]|uniref:hypothetical protein n=1 Tax=Nocardia farcinica TaxID=37329 RepID=UPI001895E4EA|nr:hypothetical protein [Nocardia farcinica]MBF6360412.1 hypothetical protein [Nocardia farcinica]